MKNKKVLWIILLVIGILFFAIPLVAGIYDSIFGFAGLCFISCDKYYGFEAFRDSIILYSFVFWPSYIVGIVFIIFSIFKLKCKKNK